MQVVLFFIDGLGLGPINEYNPLATTAMPCIKDLLDGKSLTLEAVGTKTQKASLHSLDATLGVPGLPQSATGQTTLLTGVNAARALGRHIRGFPTEPLRKILAAEGILKKVLELPQKAVFLNGYRPEFFTDLSNGERFYSATTLMNLYAGLPFHSFADMAAGRSIYSDITNEVLQEMGFDVPYVSPEKAGKTLAENAARHDFLLFEYFLTDMAAHKRDREKTAYCLTTIDRFLASILKELDLSQTLFIITSDHGNIEDLTTSGHTRNPVPLLLIGAGHDNLRPISDLTEVTPLILELLQQS
ncbi:metalloenzyme [Dethiobacter alkaliphilus]|uniref:metalloenzyme n=1 Tax=Dethiobacter alkaliphilus TaxID=427926 RepID=UPI00222631CC|nr:metalloenzyme [Dethiobacter alkaliphilus]MCW3488938.1 metalloenzyme [Dethiobacter alkaliphilus]